MGIMITIKALSPELEDDYFDFFDNRAFSDGSPYYPCYCNAFNMSVGEIVKMRELAKQYGDGYEYVESYPTVSGQTAMAFTGPVRLYEKNGFSEFMNDGKTIIMRKHLD